MSEALPTRERPMYLYFIGGELQEDLVKVGIATNPKRRLAELQVGSPVRLHLIDSFRLSPAQARRTEADFHQTMASFRVHGEWFTRDGLLYMAEVLDARERGVQDPVGCA